MTMPKYEQLHRDAHEYVRRYERRQRLRTIFDFAVFILGMVIIILVLSLVDVR